MPLRQNKISWLRFEFLCKKIRIHIKCRVFVNVKRVQNKIDGVYFLPFSVNVQIKVQSCKTNKLHFVLVIYHVVVFEPL